jgi:hypothetical protein
VLTEIFKNRKQIWEGLRNNIFKQDHIEAIYEERMDICRHCEILDTVGEGCHVQGTSPCCDKNKGGCGCSLALKLRSLSSDCPFNKWKAVVTPQEEDMIKSQILNENLSNDSKDGR